MFFDRNINDFPDWRTNYRILSLLSNKKHIDNALVCFIVMLRTLHCYPCLNPLAVLTETVSKNNEPRRSVAFFLENPKLFRSGRCCSSSSSLDAQKIKFRTDKQMNIYRRLDGGPMFSRTIPKPEPLLIWSFLQEWPFWPSLLSLGPQNHEQGRF